MGSLILKYYYLRRSISVSINIDLLLTHLRLPSPSQSANDFEPIHTNNITQVNHMYDRLFILPSIWTMSLVVQVALCEACPLAACMPSTFAPTHMCHDKNPTTNAQSFNLPFWDCRWRNASRGSPTGHGDHSGCAQVLGKGMPTKTRCSMDLGETCFGGSGSFEPLTHACQCYEKCWLPNTPAVQFVVKAIWSCVCFNVCVSYKFDCTSK